MTLPFNEFLSEPTDVHGAATGAAFGVVTAFLWVTYSRTVALALGLVFLSVVTGIRLTRLLKTVPDVGLSDWVNPKKPGNLISQLRREGHYTVSFFVAAAAVVYVLLQVF